MILEIFLLFFHGGDRPRLLRQEGSMELLEELGRLPDPGFDSRRRLAHAQAHHGHRGENLRSNLLAVSYSYRTLVLYV